MSSVGVPVSRHPQQCLYFLFLLFLFILKFIYLYFWVFVFYCYPLMNLLERESMICHPVVENVHNKQARRKLELPSISHMAGTNPALSRRCVLPPGLESWEAAMGSSVLAGALPWAKCLPPHDFDLHVFLTTKAVGIFSCTCWLFCLFLGRCPFSSFAHFQIGLSFYC